VREFASLAELCVWSVLRGKLPSSGVRPAGQPGGKTEKRGMQQQQQQLKGGNGAVVM